MRDYMKGKYAALLVERIENDKDLAKDDEKRAARRRSRTGRRTARSDLKESTTRMAGTKEIRTKIKSVQNTRKITKAMEMVAASKMRKAQERMRQARPYGEKIRNVAAQPVARQPGVPPSVPASSATR